MRVFCIGSMNLDYVLGVGHLVGAGETIAACSRSTNAGGKGLNQSIAAARAGAQVVHAGCVGADGAPLVDLLEASGVDVSHVRMVDEPQGCAFIQVEEDTGENAIVIFGGSNQALTDAYVDEVLDALDAGDLVLVQNEVSAMPHVLDVCARRGVDVVWNPAPMREDLLSANLKAVRWLIMNEHEAAQFAGTCDLDACWEAVRRKAPAASLVVTRGRRGCVAYTDEGRLEQRAYPVEALDTTGAGDTFCGYLVCAICEGRELAPALDLASRAAALAVTRPGAAPAIPWRDQVERAFG